MNIEVLDAETDVQANIDAIGRISQLSVILETVQLATGMGFAAVARVTEAKWITCSAIDHISFGLEPGDELEVESTLCHEVRQSCTEIVIDDVASDPDYHRHHTPARYGFRSYISVPIWRSDGRFFGTLCAIDPDPKTLSNERVLGMFRLFAQMIGEALDADEKLYAAENAVDHERRLAGVQERFVAILAHDLRNPVSVLNAGFRLMGRHDLLPETIKIISLMKGSVHRMSDLIENLLYQARTRSENGIEIMSDLTGDLAPVLHQLVAELDAVSPDLHIVADIDVPHQVRCDVPRLAQIVSNLLTNAITHGADGAAVRLTAKMAATTLIISVANNGPAIPADQISGLFHPFEQGGDRPSRKGLGLGLYIASEIAKGHGGTLDVESDEDLTVFTLTIPNAV